MLKRCSCLIETLFACWLIVMASGDDFNVCRIVIPLLPSSSPNDSLPLDDPNTDFTRVDDSQSSQDVRPYDVSDANSSERQPASSFAIAFSLLVDSCPACCCPSRIDPFTCMRC